jgi:phosphoglucomutase
MKKIPMRSYAEALELAESWTRPPFDSDTIHAVKALLDLPENDRQTAILDRFGYDLSFGTAGMRAIMDVGPARVNAYTIAKVSAAVAAVLQTRFSKPSVVIGFDGRKNSLKYARLAQQQFLSAGIDVYAFPNIMPTPLVPFAVRRLKAHCGVMITSSHNAAPYNGYKVYAANGAQILSPFDTEVMDAMASGRVAVATNPGQLHTLDEEILKAYVAWVTAEVDFASNRSLRIVFTPLHGAAGAMMNAVFYRSGFKNFYPVPQQYEPRPDFPTVVAPNPENPDSLRMAIEKATEEGADLILATDGDGDRVGVAYRQGSGYTRLTGNQIGTLFLYYLLVKLREKKSDLSRAFALSSIVSTPLTAAICAKFGIRHFETLTGFKNMGNRADEICEQEPEARMILAFEEAFGVTIGDSRDKDGIISCLLGAHIAADGGIDHWLKRMYAECGYYAEDAIEREFPGAEGIAQMANAIEKIRSAPFQEFLGSSVICYRDFKTRIQIREGNSTAITEIPLQNLLYFENAAGDWLAFRPSGTEPKLKAYVGIRLKSAYSSGTIAQGKDRLSALCEFALNLLE